VPTIALAKGETIELTHDELALVQRFAADGAHRARDPDYRGLLRPMLLRATAIADAWAARSNQGD
jgi:hypothetical protein